MAIINGMNDDIIEYFSLEEYVERIKLKPSVLKHLEETNNNFIKYITKLLTYDEDYIINYWIFLLYKELKSSQRIEHIDFEKINLIDNEVFFDTLSISHHRIHELHSFIMNDEAESHYRTKEVNVSKYLNNGEEKIFWRGVKAKDIDRFMNDFIKIYKRKDVSILMSNPFLKSSLIHLLFMRIHPYTDGNGRTSRLLHNTKFTESINNIYGTRLKISPLNLSQSILINKLSYTRALDNIYFDLKHDTNDAINWWFNIMLNMADEQIFRSTNAIEKINPKFIKEVKKSVEDAATSMLIRKLNK